MNKKIIIGIVVVVVLLGGSFYGGMKYGEGKGTVRGAFGTVGQFGRTGAQGGQLGARTGGATAGRLGGGLVSGEVLSMDASSLTLKLPTGGSRIVLIASSTTVSKLASSTIQEIKTGDDISVQGMSNADGSITAQSVQMRPMMPMPAGR